ncbi:PQQ-dependent sugar dehydrogenase [Elongatibacter sediminis]|uniref:PQQ-dependent sugar dehydrogenase n=1 Tax=Elongatibacter sediminis TaxID=3119006 RepID=A0AAW9RKQ2_9GAMM
MRNILLRLAALPAFLALSPAGLSANATVEQHLAEISLPEGFVIELYASGVENARQLVRGPGGTVFAGSRKAGKVHAVSDTDNDGFAERVVLIDEDLVMPTGLEFRDGALFVGALDRILRYDDIESSLDDPPEPVVVSDAFPDKTHHGWKYLRFGPDGWLYVPVGAPCNICDETDFAEIRRIRPDGSGMEVWARGVRNSVGLAFRPESGELYFTDNGRDLLEDNLPSDELNHAPRKGMHFGYPYCHQGDVADPEFGAGRNCAEFTAPAAKLGPHVAALGLTFYSGEQFPAEYRGNLFIARHGSWNRSAKLGYDIVQAYVAEDGSISGADVFASGWLQGEQEWGRPNDLLMLPDGSLLVSDDAANAIYRIRYAGE